MGFSQVFSVFLLKNWLYLKFNYRSVLFGLTTFAVVVFMYLKSTYSTSTTLTVFYDTQSTDILKERFPANDGDYLYYAPVTPFTDALMEDVRQELQLLGDKLKPIENATELRAILETACRGNCFAIDFEQSPAGLPVEVAHDRRIRYSISSSAMRISPSRKYVNDEEVVGIKDEDEYIRSGFFTLQHIVDKLLISTLNNNKDNKDNDYDVEIAAMPTAEQEVVDSQRVIYFGSIFSILFGVLLLGTFLVPLVEEKQDGIKEFLVIATPMNFLNGVTFFMLRLVVYMVFVSGALLAAYNYRALGVPATLYIIVLYILYVLSYMAYAYLISVFFHSVFYAKVGGLVMLIAPYIFFLVIGGLSHISTYVFSTKAFIEGLKVFQTFTNKHREFTYQDLTANITESSSSIAKIYTLIIVQAVLYGCTYIYLSGIFPGPGGLKKSYFFIFQALYKKKQRNEYTTTEAGTDAIIVQDLTKTFRTSTGTIQIADRLNMNIENKRITVLLGHNGAGKTTTLNMIMGSVPKDGGKIIVCSEGDVASYRHLIGFCPQHSVFMTYMTCAQHLQFFAQLRGLSRRESVLLANLLLEQLKLTDKANEFGKNLSGGMKRRLSLGIALSGNTKVVILDEPSSGLDIESRRELWDILLELRKRKAILITTHHMEEAEVLGDTVCILANGRLQRKGSPLELKRKVGTGYILKLNTNSELFREAETLSLIQQYVTTAKILNVVPPTVLISLPYAFKSQYCNMLHHVEQQQTELGITSISITDTSLEDVFLNCANEGDQVDGPSINASSHSLLYESSNATKEITSFQQFRAIAYKKLIFLQNEWHYVLLMVCLPFVCISLSIFLMQSMATGSEDGALHLSLGNIKAGVVYIYNPERNAKYQAIEDNLLTQISRYNVRGEKLILREQNTVAQEIVAMEMDNLAYFLQNVIGVIELGPPASTGATRFKLHFSGNVYHSSVILLNLIDNAMLQLNDGDAQIDTYYAPIRRFLTEVSPMRLENYAIIVPIGLFFYMFFYLALPFREYISGFKNLQAIPRSTYWWSVYLLDCLMHTAVCALLYVWQMLLMPKGLYSTDEQLLIIFTIAFYGFSYLAILYGFANGVRSISTIATYLVFMVVLSGILPLITSSNVKAMEDHETLIMFLCLLPDFNLSHQLRVINENFIITRKVLTTANALSTGTFFIYALLIFLLSMNLFVYVLEHKERYQDLMNFLSLRQCRTCVKPKTTIELLSEEEESIVRQEKITVERVLKDKIKYPLIVNDLHKYYDGRAAVRGVSFVVNPKECFGLLGVNGAGKTSTFEMIAANLSLTTGTIQIDGVDLVEHEAAYRYRFGYCPQNDCLNNFMTAYQMLSYMAQLRGVNEHNRENEINYWLEKLNLQKYKTKEIRHYSGGTKRKLNAAVAMIGSPTLILLDEPTTGVDPVSRRFLWKCIREYQKNDGTVVLTSHSMDECEQLCNRLAIMIGGRFKCLGNIQELKLRYGSGFTIKFKIKKTAANSDDDMVSHLTTKLRSYFSDSELRENHAGILTYFIKNESHILWSDVFQRAEAFYNDCADSIDDYSVNESTLEDIFLKFDPKRQSSPTNSEEFV